MFKKVSQNESGIVLVTVLAISVVLIILMVGYLGTNLNFVSVGQKQIDRVRTDQLVKQTWWRNYMSLATGNGPLTAPGTALVYEGYNDHTIPRTYFPTVAAVGGATAGPFGTQQYNVAVPY